MRDPRSGCPGAAGGDHPADETPRRVSDLAGDLLARRAPLGPTSWDAESRTCEAVIASETPVRRSGPAPDGSAGAWDEVLVISPSSVDLSRAEGAPVLRDHSATGDSHIGALSDVRIVRRELVATMRLSGRDDVAPILDDIAAGIVRSVSVGYRVQTWEAAGNRTWRATKWTPMEVSIVPIAADPSARIRSTVSVETKMSDVETVPVWGINDYVDLARAAEKLGVPSSVVSDCYERGLTVQSTRDAIIDYRADLDSKVETRSYIRGGVDHTDPASIRERMVGALLHRSNPGAFPLADDSREFRALPLAEMKRTLLEARGVRTRGWSSDEIFTRGDVGALHATSDFSLLLADVMNKSLEREISAAESPLKTLSREQQANDFRSLYVSRIGNASALEKVNEHGEFTRGTWNETRESFALSTYGKIWGITRQVMVNDDLGFFSDISAETATVVIELEASQFISLLVGAAGLGAVGGDGKTAFHSDHANVGTGGAISETTVSEARQLLRAQKGTGGLHLIGATPRAILVPAALETAAEKFIGTITPAVADEVNPFAGRLAVLVEPRLASATRWYVFAEQQFFTHAYLQGNRAPQVATREGFDVDGVEFRVRHDFGCHIRDWRLAVTNAGQ